MSFLTVAALLLVRIVVTDGREFELVASRSIVINESVSSSLFNESNNFRSDAECMSWCEKILCVVAVVNETNQMCQMLVINDESSEPGPNGSHVTRQLGSPDDLAVRVWKADDFQIQLPAQVNELVFKTTSTGRFGVIQNFTVDTAGCFRIQAFGAAGGSTVPISSGVRPGYGAFAAGSFSLVAGTKLEIVVGQMGENVTCEVGAGGGGGSFVYTSGGSPELLIAAGGGGAMSGYSPGVNGSNDTSGTASDIATDPYTGAGGVNGAPGQFGAQYVIDTTASCGGPGAGWNGPASKCGYNHPGGGGLSRSGGWLGGERHSISCVSVAGNGGFGGGGAGGGCCDSSHLGAGGGGGGYSGGGAFSRTNNGGGGGGSYCGSGATGCTRTAGANTELQGRVVLKRIGDTCGG